MHSSVLPTFSSMSFSVFDFMLRSLIHLKLSFVHGDRYQSIFILLHVDIQLCQYHLLKVLFSILHFSLLVKNQPFKCVDWYMSLWFASISPPVCFYASTRLFSVLKLCSRVWSQGMWSLQKFLYWTELFWLSWVFFFPFPYEVEYCPLSSVKNFSGILMGKALNL